MCILVVIVLRCIEASCDTIEMKWNVSITIMGVAYIPTEAFTRLLYILPILNQCSIHIERA